MELSFININEHAHYEFPAVYENKTENVVIEESVNTHISADIQAGSVSIDTIMQLTNNSKKN